MNTLDTSQKKVFYTAYTLQTHSSGETARRTDLACRLIILWDTLAKGENAWRND